MRRLQVKRREYRGEITAFLSLIFVLLLSLIGALVQSASIHITKSMKRADTSLALESVFAEYEPELLKEYGVFAKANTDETQLSRRLWFYGAKNMEHKIQKIKLLSDESGQAFYEQAILSMGGNIPDIQTFSNELWEEEAGQVNRELEAMLQETGETLPTENNPLESIKQLEASDFLSLIIQNPEKISNRYVDLSKLPSHRTLQTGTKKYLDVSTEGVSQKVLFVGYLDKHFPSYADEEEEDALLYQQEYLLEGESTDQDNLEAVMKKILMIRVGANYAYLLTDQTKQAEAESVAVGLCSLLAVPEIASIVKQAILFAWAYGESIQDVKVLAKGEKIPFVKTQETWQVSIQGLLQLGTVEDTNPQINAEKGLSYSDYVKAFILAENTERLCMRAMDLIELNTKIRVDDCVTAVQIKSTCDLQRGIRDTFVTDYHYQ